MLRKSLAVLLLLIASCTVAPVPTPPVVPTATATAVILPTDAPPDRLYTPSRMSRTLGYANVIETDCYVRTTTIAGYTWGLVWSYDTAAYAACVKKGTL